MAKRTKEDRESYRQFMKQQTPAYHKEVKAMRKRDREDVHGKGVVTRGKNKGLKRVK